MSSAVLALGLTSSCAFGAELALPSKIDAVDLHLDSAEVTRTAHWSLPAGDTSIVLRGLPPRLVEQSLRLSGLETYGVSIRSVSTRRDAANADPTTSPKDQALIDEQSDLKARLDALQAKEAMIRNVAAAKPTVEIGASVSAPPDYWPSLWAKVADGLEETDHRMRETRKRLDVVTATLVDQVRAVTPIASDLDVVVDVSAEHAVEGDMTLVYQVVGPTWQPLYDARLRTDRKPAQLDLVRRARIDQSSGEDWSDVVLTLSTASLSSGTAAPTLNETSDATGDSRQGIVASRPVATGTSPIRTPTHIERTTTPYDARLQVPGRVSIASGSKARLISLGTTRADVDLSVRSIPIADRHAYLQAKFENTDRLALVPGEAALYRDGAFVGRSTIAGATSGDQVTIGFGVDDLVSLERSDIGRGERNTTVESGTASVTRAFRTVVTNRHPFPIRIEIDDREPAFNNAAIVLREMPTMTAPTERQIDGHRGVLGWTYTYAAGETRTVNLAWNVRWPAKLGPIQGSETTQFFRFSGGATF